MEEESFSVNVIGHADSRRRKRSILPKDVPRSKDSNNIQHADSKTLYWAKNSHLVAMSSKRVAFMVPFAMASVKLVTHK